MPPDNGGFDLRWRRQMAGGGLKILSICKRVTLPVQVIRVVSFNASTAFGVTYNVVRILMFFAIITIARQFIYLQQPISITIHPMKHGD